MLKLILLTYIFLISTKVDSIPIANCPFQCTCDLIQTKLQIFCSGSNPSFTIPSPINDPNLFSVDNLVISSSFLQNFPNNLCVYNRLKKLDLSLNQIKTNITSSTFNCLTELTDLDLSNNEIQQISETAFDFNQKLIRLDLSSNKIASIPRLLFPYKLQNLQNLNLKNNLISELDIWYFYLKNIQVLDLSYNRISVLKNDLNFSINSTLIYPSLAQSQLIDLRYNQLRNFNDDVLKLYKICDELSYSFFIRLLYTMRIDNNPLECNCSKSFNFINFYVSNFLINFLDINNNIFKARCTNQAYLGQSIFNFAVLDTDPDCLVTYAFSVSTCPFRIPQASTLSPVIGANIPQNLINEPSKSLNETNIDYFNDAQIAGYVIGILGILILFLLLIYFICPIEILSVCFNCIPIFYSICPCKSGVKRDKEFDLFISYNLSNESWVRNKLIPFINRKELIENYILHYNDENTKKEVFNSYIKGVMSKSSCILFVLSDSFLMNEWNNKEFQFHLRYLVTREKTRFIAVQMHDICDEEVDEYFIEKLQIPRFVSLENDEFLFWNKLAYFLHTNNNIQEIQPAPIKKPTDYKARPNDDIIFDTYKINRPIIHVPKVRDPEAHDNELKILPLVKKPPKSKNTKNTKKKKEKRLLSESSITSARSFQGISRLNTPMENQYEIVRLDNNYNPIERVHPNVENELRLGLSKIKNYNDIDDEKHLDSLVVTKEFDPANYSNFRPQNSARYNKAYDSSEA